MFSVETHQPVVPVKPVAGYLGGKSRLAKKICAQIEAIPHQTYAEPFVGMGGIFLRRKTRPKSEVINDYNQEISNLFLMLQRHYSFLKKMLSFYVTSRTQFNLLKNTNPSTLTELERAVRFLYLQRLAFGGKVSGQAFGVATDRPARFDMKKLDPILEKLHERLTDVVIESLDYKEFISRYDRSSTLFYLDPPYYGGENDYGRDMFSRDDFQIIADLMTGLKGRFILSINDHPEIREMFASFQIRPVNLRYSIAQSVNTEARELIIFN